MLAHQALVYVDVVEVQVGELGPVFVVSLDEAGGYFVNDFVARMLFDGGLDRLALIRLDVLRRQRLPHKLKPFVDGLLVGGRAVFAEQELDDEGGHAEGGAHSAHQVFTHDQTRENFIRQSVQIVKYKRLLHHHTTRNLHVARDGQLHSRRR